MTRVSSRCFSDPRGRSEAEWLAIIDELLLSLEAFCETSVELGPYWMDIGDRGYASAALGTRLRARGPLRDIPCDSWEAALCLTGSGDETYIDALVFPFVDGSTLTPRGRFADLPDDDVTDIDVYWLHLEPGGWEDRGWSPPHGHGEWREVQEPGDACFTSVTCTVAAGRDEPAGSCPAARRAPGTSDRARGPRAGSQASTVGRAATASLDCEVAFAKHFRGKVGAVSVSINSLTRNGDGRVVAPPPRVRVPRIGDSRRVPAWFSDAGPELIARVDLASVVVPGGWTPGDYRVELRWHATFDGTSEEAFLSDALELSIPQ